MWGKGTTEKKKRLEVLLASGSSMESLSGERAEIVRFPGR